MKICNKVLHITKTDFEHSTDITWKEFIEGIEDEMFLHGLDGKKFDKIQIDCVDTEE